VRHHLGLSRATIFATIMIVTANPTRFAIAQTANSNAGLQGGQDGLFDAILATPNQKTPVPQDNIFATAPGAEQAARTPQFTLNILAPAFYNSNTQFLSSGASQALEGSPVVRLGWASQLFGTSRSGFPALPASKPSDLPMPLALRSTISALPRGHSISIPKMTRTIHPSFHTCRGWISIRLSQTTLPRGRT
jgi:hypothetical protein